MQFFPLKPGRHAHVYPAAPSLSLVTMQEPEFSHGFLEHGSAESSEKICGGLLISRAQYEYKLFD